MRGSTTAIIQPNGSLIKGYSYDEFGQLEQTGASGFLNEVTYTGSVTDTSTGLQYMNARFYNPSTGRFLSQDSYKGNAYDPWTQHLYGYCGNNPINMTDPTGHYWVDVNYPPYRVWVTYGGDGSREDRKKFYDKYDLKLSKDEDWRYENKEEEKKQEKKKKKPLNETMKDIVNIKNKDVNGTITIIQLEATAAASVVAGTVSAQLVADVHGNIGFQWTYGAGVSVTPSGVVAAANVTAGGTNAYDIFDLTRIGMEIGGGVGNIFGVTGAVTRGYDADTLGEALNGAKQTYTGGMGGGGVTTPGGEGHVFFTITEFIGEPWNIYDTPIVKDIINVMGEWFY